MTVDAKYRKDSFWFRFQIFLSLSMVMQYIIRIIIYPVLGEKLYGDIALGTCFYASSYLVSIFIIALERTKVLSSSRVRGHGLILVLFWTLAFINENLAFISWGSPHYWWHLDTSFHAAMFGLWLTRYVLTLSLFILGLRAPGLPRRSYMLIINDELNGPVRIHT